MKKRKSLYRGHRFPAVVIRCAVRRYFRLGLSLRGIEALLFERGVRIKGRSKPCPHQWRLTHVEGQRLYD
jgi:putative transposase